MNRSIQSRLILSASVVLFCFLGLAGFVLDAAYKHVNTDAQLAKHTRARQLVHLMHAQMGSIPSDQRTDSKV